MKSGLVFVTFLFVLYYSYALFIFYRLNKNDCACNKMDKFKDTWNFKAILILTPILLINNLFLLYKALTLQTGGNGLYYNVLLTISIGYGIVFFYDYAVLSLFNYMKNEKCPCQEKHRSVLNNLTIVKLIYNAFFYITIITKLDKKTFDTLLKKMVKFAPKKMKKNLKK